ncbi:NADH-quinone oxidoreductase subunit NuoF [Tepidibacter aestuarii]|uniref:NADH-quinone oxidoreductase subunit NuoF n=1 Tax=Tepidibacter aestuarii TaxID=2925782 RepID=UPI0020C113E6|nr:NADH-quinone oxidoreductase subunit NuoF [Tepidibacter aestuarii]CAH2214056.1 NADP-reducing hydrogenase subunit HndC [Tepidibacter aestuarii]
MSKIKSFKDLINLNETLKPLIDMRNNTHFEDTDTNLKEILVCGGTGCHSAESDKIIENLKASIKSNNLLNKVKVSLTGCFGFCAKGPIVKIFPDNVFYVNVSPKDAEEIISEHILKGNVIDRLLFEEPTINQKVKKHDDMSFYKKQMRIALRNCGLINPEDINEYIAENGYMALGEAITSMSREEVIDVLKKSGLRGRGGAGFPTGLKWESTLNASSHEKYVICNADEGDPGAFMDRSVLEGDPHSVLEAMIINGYAIGSNNGYIYIRAEYPLAIHRLRIAIDQAREFGFLGKDILGTGFDFDIELKYGAGAFVCGEATALIHSIEGNRGEPRMKTISSSKQGLWSKPTCVNNVETYANIPAIMLNGAKWYSSIGTENSKGTKVFALGGKINNVGLVEVPMGTTLREIIFEIGGGIPNNKKFKAVQTGGPSGGCIPSKFLDTPIDFDSLNAIGSMMGSGGMLVLDETDCMVNIAKFFLEFTVDESCGKCTPCRIGNKRLHEILTRITEGKGSEQDLYDLKDLAETIKDTSLCGLGKTSPNPVLSTMKYFMNEYEDHVIHKKCSAGSCQALLDYFITDKCIGCTKCSKICPANAISGKVKETHVIDNEQCLKCGACLDACKFNAIIKK